MELKFLSQLPEMMTIDEIVEAARLKSRSTVYRWFEDGLESVRIGGVRRVPKDAFIRFIEVSSGTPGGHGGDK